MKTIIALVLLVVTAANAQLVVDYTGGDQLSVGPGTAAFDFTTGAQAPPTLFTLGIWESSGEGLFNPHTVGIWDATTKALLRSAIVQQNDAVKIGQFWYVNIAPLTLESGHRYVLGASYADSDFDFALGNIQSVVMGGGVTLGDALLSTGSGFEFPTLNVSGANLGFIGPNAGFTAVPEPSEALAMSALALGAFAVARRFRNRHVATS